MKNKEEALKGIINSIRDSKPANIGPLVDKVMAEKVKEIIVKKQREISKEL
jgi:hypothetical protein